MVEVVKAMQELELCPDVETLSNYILPVFPSMKAARHALKVINCVCVFTFGQRTFKKFFADIKVIFIYLGGRHLFGLGELPVFRGSFVGC